MGMLISWKQGFPPPPLQIQIDEAKQYDITQDCKTWLLPF